VRDKGRDDSLKVPLNKGLLLKNGRDEGKMSFLCKKNDDDHVSEHVSQFARSLGYVNWDFP
jgi:hypothetical protein